MQLEGKRIGFVFTGSFCTFRKTIEELKKRDDAWFNQQVMKEEVTNHYCWFHVMEHQSSHLGQILFLKKRIPPQKEIILEQKIKN